MTWWQWLLAGGGVVLIGIGAWFAWGLRRVK